MTATAVKHAQRHELLVQTEIVARRENVPRKLSGKSAHHSSSATKFCDSIHWDELATKYLSRYDLPAWDVPCGPEAMARWLDRLDIPLKQYLRMTSLRSLEDFITMNPAWPLRAFIGLALEMRNEEVNDDAG
jgi:hypothetical protein